jgi:hypothetical protein
LPAEAVNLEETFFDMSWKEEEHLDVLQNIEFGIMQIYRAEKDLIDADALDAVDALVRHYVAEENGRQASEHRLTGKPVRVFLSVKEMCEWRLGRQNLAADSGYGPTPPITVPELVRCLRRIQKSIRRWTEVGGRTGYLEFVSQYVV